MAPSKTRLSWIAETIVFTQFKGRVSYRSLSFSLYPIPYTASVLCYIYEPSADSHDWNATRGTGDAAGVITSPPPPHNRSTLTLTSYFLVCEHTNNQLVGAHSGSIARREACADTNFVDARHPPRLFRPRSNPAFVIASLPSQKLQIPLSHVHLTHSRFDPCSFSHTRV